jgi:hypothetical protein
MQFRRSIGEGKMQRRLARWLTIGAFVFAFAATASAQPSLAPPFRLPGLPSLQVGTLEVRDINVGDLAIGRAVFRGVRHEGLTVVAERVTLENVSATAGARRIGAPEITVSDVTFPAEVFLAITMGANLALDWASALTHIRAGEIRVPAMADEDSATATKGAYVNLVLDGLRGGVIASIRIESTAIETGGAGVPDPVRLTTGAASWRAIDLVEFLRFDTGGGAPDRAPKQLIESGVIESFSAAAPGVTLTVQRIDLASLHGRAPATPLAPPGPPRILPPGQPDPELAEAARYIGEAIQHLRLERLALSGLQVQMPDVATLSLEGMALSGFTGSGIERFEISGGELGGDAPNVKLGRFVLEKLGYGGVLKQTLTALAAGREPELSAAQLAEAPPSLGAVRLFDLSADTAHGPLSLSRFSIEADPPEAAAPERVTLALGGLVLELPKDDSASRGSPLARVGYRDMKADAQLQLRWIAGENALVLEDTRLAIAQVGDIELAVRLGNLDFAAAASKPELVEQILDKAHIDAIELRLADGGFADRFFAQFAREAGLSDAEARNAAAQDIRKQAEEFFDAALAPGASEALEAFVRKPGKLIARLVPRPGQPPLALGDLEQLSPPEINRRIAVTIEATAN